MGAGEGTGRGAAVNPPYDRGPTVAEPIAPPAEAQPSAAPRGELALPVLAAYALILSEWLFFATKASFLTRFGLVERVGIGLAAALPVAVVAVLLQVLLEILLAGHRSRVAAMARALPAAVLAAALLLLLVENFTYVVFGFSALSTDSRLVRAGYGLFFALLLLGTSVWVDRRRARRTAPGGCLPAGVLLGLSVVAAVALAVAGSAGGGGQRRHASEGGPQEPSAAAAPVEAARRPNILFLSADGISASRTSLYGYRRDTTPFLRRFAAASVVYDNAFPNVSRTYGSLLSMLSGAPPEATRTAFPPAILVGSDAFDHLPRLLREVGYTTAQVTIRDYADAVDANMRLAFDDANGRKVDHLPAALMWATRTGGLLPAWYLVEQVGRRLADRVVHVLGLRQVRGGFEFVIDKHRSVYLSDATRMPALLAALDMPEPWFLHVHLMDTHCCGWPGLPPNPPNKAVAAAYDSEIAVADRRFAQAVGGLRDRKLLARTLIVFSSDHGIGWSTDERVPLMIHFPGSAGKGRMHENVQLLDVAPTVLEYLGLPAAPWMTGTSLLHRPPADRPLLSFNRAEFLPYAANPRVKVIAEPGPPWYGAASVGLVACDAFFDLDLATGAIAEKRLARRGRSRCQAPAAGAARDLIVGRLRSHGFPAPPAPAPPPG